MAGEPVGIRVGEIRGGFAVKGRMGYFSRYRGLSRRA